MSSGKGKSGGGGRSRSGASATGTVAAVVGAVGAASAADSAAAKAIADFESKWGKGGPAQSPRAQAAAEARASAAASKPAAPTFSSAVKSDGSTSMTPRQFDAAVAASPKADQDRLLRAIDKVASTEQEGSALYVPKVRAEAARLGLRDKISFDAAAARLSQDDRVVMHYYDRPASMRPAERRELAFAPTAGASVLGGEFFIHIARRRGSS
jgi:hypothetical protein